MNHVPAITLNNGMTMPQLGLGVYQATDTEAEAAVSTAIEAGYRLFDTAAMYQNEGGVGRAIRQSSVPREELFVTTKLWNTEQGYDKALKAFEASRNRLGLEYIDLYLIHWPCPAKDLYIETWKALETLHKDGKVKAIGVSNFMPEHLERLMAEAKTTPAVNQIELHPGFLQQETRTYCTEHDIAVEAWSPLGGSRKPMINHSTIVEIANRLHKTAAQVILRWHIQHGFVVIPKSTHAERIRENISVFDFELTRNDMLAIDDIGDGDRHGPDPRTLG